MIRTPILALALAALVPATLAAQEAAPEATQDDEAQSDEAQSAQQAQEGTEPAAAEQDPSELPPEEAAATEAAQADASASQGGTGALVNGDGAQVGNASVSVTPSGVALVTVQAEGVAEGAHGVHLHMVGACDGPTFESAGEHLGEEEHGVMSAGGPHVGDLPNANVGSDGVMTYEAFAVAGLTLDMVFDEDGSALIVHAEPDDYATQPGGGSGDRIACAVIEPGGDLVEAGSTDGQVTEGDTSEAEMDAEQAEGEASGG